MKAKDARKSWEGEEGEEAGEVVGEEMAAAPLWKAPGWEMGEAAVEEEGLTNEVPQTTVLQQPEFWP